MNLQCRYPGCTHTRRTRGLCHGHYQVACDRIRKGFVTESNLEARGLLLTKGTGGAYAPDLHDVFRAGSDVYGSFTVSPLVEAARRVVAECVPIPDNESVYVTKGNMADLRGTLTYDGTSGDDVPIRLHRAALMAVLELRRLRDILLPRFEGKNGEPSLSMPVAATKHTRSYPRSGKAGPIVSLLP